MTFIKYEHEIKKIIMQSAETNDKYAKYELKLSPWMRVQPLSLQGYQKFQSPTVKRT